MVITTDQPQSQALNKGTDERYTDAELAPTVYVLPVASVWQMS